MKTDYLFKSVRITIDKLISLNSTNGDMITLIISFICLNNAFEQQHF